MTIVHTAASARRDASLPLVIDLDGTLIYSDLLWEAIVLFLRQRFLQLWRLPLWLFEGKAGFKRRLASQVRFDPAALVYDEALLKMIAEERARGREIVLATGADRQFAQQVADHLRLFDRVFATDGRRNLTADNKADHLVSVFGEGGFDYVGNANADVPVWNRSRDAYSVTTRPFLLAAERRTEHAGTARGHWGGPLLKAMRPRQWLKNLLVFVPMFTAHQLNAATFLQSCAAFLAFSLCASSAYLLNDVLDAADDRLHPTKRRRPVAAGTLPLPAALFTSALLAVAGLAACLAANRALLMATAAYFAATLAYSLYLKRQLMIDIIALAILYSMRIIGGGASTGIEPSFWLLAFSFFIFLSLAMIKRHSELGTMIALGKTTAHGRAYGAADRPLLGIMGVCSAFISVLVFILYVNSPQVSSLYPHPLMLAGVVPLLVLWLGRLWMLSFRDELHEDPVFFVSKDATSLVIIALCGALASVAAVG